jgi:hypothetical protein
MTAQARTLATMSEISTRIQAYHDGGRQDWPALRDWLVAHRYTEPRRYDDPQPDGLEERDWQHSYVDGSWDEVERARNHDLLTAAEVMEVTQLLWEQRGAART